MWILFIPTFEENVLCVCVCVYVLVGIYTKGKSNLPVLIIMDKR